MITIAGEMSIYRAAELKPLLLEAIDDGGLGPVEIDLAEVSEFDTAGLQLLLLARQAARQAGRALRLLAPSTAVREVLALLDGAALLGDTLDLGAPAPGEPA